MADIEYFASLDDSEVIKALKRIEAAVKESGEAGARSFDRIQEKSGGAIIAAGALAGATATITEKLIDLGAEAARVFAGIAEAGLGLNANLEQTERIFDNLFNDPELGEATVNFLGRLAKELRIGRDEAAAFAQTILPKSGGLDTFAELLRLTSIQARTTGQTIDDLEFSIREALSGDFVSIRDRFDLSKDQIERIKELTPALGSAAAIAAVLNEEFEALGKTQLGGTFADSIAVIKNEFTDLNQILFEGPFEQLADSAERALGVFEDKRPELEAAARVLSDLLGDVTELVTGGTLDAIENVNLETVIELATRINDAVDSLRLLNDTLDDFGTGFDFGDYLNRIVGPPLAKIQTDAIRLSVALGEIQAQVAKFQAIQQARIAGGAQDVFGLAVGRVDEETAQQALIDGQAAYDEAIEKSIDRLTDYSEALQNNAAIAADRAGAIDDSAQADAEAAINADLAARALEAQSRKVLEAEEEIAAKRTKLAQDLANRLRDINQRNADRRVDDAIKNADKLEDIQRKQNERLEDAARDLSRAEADLARKQSNERLEIARKQANRRRDIEQNTAEEIRRIRLQASFDSTEAERNNDARRFLEIQRQAAQRIKEAEAGRKTDLKDAEQTAADETAKLKVEQTEQLAAIQEKNRRALEDLSIRLERELEAQRIAEERQAAERQRQEARSLRDFNQLEQDKQRTLADSLAKQLELVANFYSQQEKMAAESAARIAEIHRSVSQGGADPDNPFGTPFSGGIDRNRNRAMINQPSIPQQPPIVTNSTTNQNLGGFSVSQSMLDDPVQRAGLENFIIETLGKVQT